MGAGTVLLSLVTGVGAVAASSCCALPLALTLAGLGGAWLGGWSDLIFYRPWFLVAAALALAMGWTMALRQRRVACTAADGCARQGSGLTFGALGLSTLLAGTAVAWNWIEPAVMTALLLLAEGMA